MRQITSTLSDAEYDQFIKAVNKTGDSTYRFVKEAVLEHVEKVMLEENGSRVEEMVEALKSRKWALYQFQDYSDKNHLSWLMTRFPDVSTRQRQEALHRFRMAQEVKT